MAAPSVPAMERREGKEARKAVSSPPSPAPARWPDAPEPGSSGRHSPPRMRRPGAGWPARGVASDGDETGISLSLPFSLRIEYPCVAIQLTGSARSRPQFGAVPDAGRAPQWRLDIGAAIPKDRRREAYNPVSWFRWLDYPRHGRQGWVVRQGDPIQGVCSHMTDVAVSVPAAGPCVSRADAALSFPMSGMACGEPSAALLPVAE